MNRKELEELMKGAYSEAFGGYVWLSNAMVSPTMEYSAERKKL